MIRHVRQVSFRRLPKIPPFSASQEIERSRPNAVAVRLFDQMRHIDRNCSRQAGLKTTAPVQRRPELPSTWHRQRSK